MPVIVPLIVFFLYEFLDTSRHVIVVFLKQLLVSGAVSKPHLYQLVHGGGGGGLILLSWGLVGGSAWAQAVKQTKGYHVITLLE